MYNFSSKILFQQLNDSTIGHPFYLAHESFVTNPQEQQCGTVNELPANETCNFVREIKGCHENVQYIDYMNFLYCSITVYHPVIYYLCVTLLIMECIYMFTILGITADKFFCPALTVLSDVMGLGENIAGVTILAFGNGSPDLFTALADYEGDTEMLFAELLGAATFIIGIVSAVIMIVRPFTVSSMSFIRDLLFFMLSVMWISHAFKDQTITLIEAIGTIGIYIFYLLVVIIEHFIIKMKVKQIKIHPENEEPQIEQHQIEYKNLNEELRFNILKNSKEILTDYKITARSSFQAFGPNDKLIHQFLHSINPIDFEEWHEAKYFGKVLIILKIPVILLILLFIPIVDYTIENHGWTKLLNSLQIITLPIGIILLKQWYNLNFGGISIFLYVILIGIPVIIAIFFTSRTDQPPKYHLCFAIFGSFIGSICLISSIASEVVAILSTLGIISNLSNSFLGLSILAWGNSIGDLISNIALARQGYAKMSFAACFGGPMFNNNFVLSIDTLLGMGIVFNLKLYNSEHDGGIFAREGVMGQNCSIFLFMILVFTLLGFSLTGFQARRSIGIFMLFIYVLFILFSLLGEFEIIHPFGTDHRNEGEFIS